MDPAEKHKLSTELQQIVMAQSSPEEVQAFEDQPLSEKRKAFGLEPLTVPGVDAETLSEFTWAEESLITESRNLGIPGATVRGLRKDAVQLALQASDTGRPISDDQLNSVLGRYRLNDQQRQVLRRLFRQLEGGA